MSGIGGNPQVPKRERSPEAQLAPAVLQKIPAVAGAGGSATSSPIVSVTTTVTSSQEEAEKASPAVETPPEGNRVTSGATVVLPSSISAGTVQAHLAPFALGTAAAQAVSVTTAHPAPPASAGVQPSVHQTNLLHTVTAAAAAVSAGVTNTGVYVPAVAAPGGLGDVTAAMAGPCSGGSTDGARSLRVEDALSYLDVVKNRFSNRPNVYAEFLDVMRDFKSQSIDTNTVVNRVNELFETHTDLIQAFNQFLPVNQRASPLPGAGASHIAPQTVVSLPHAPSSLQGSIVQGDLMSLSLASADVSGTRNIVPNSSIFGSGAPSRLPTGPAGGLLRAGGVGSLGVVSVSGTGAGSGVNVSGGAASGGGPHGATGEGTQRNQPEFSQAITYVNKIKTRFSHQPDKYKQFLEILQKYQQQGQANAPILGGMAGAAGVGLAAAAGGAGLGVGPGPGRRLGGPGDDRPFSDMQVYKQVSRLFEGQSDLLHEFRTFLPEVNQAMLSVEALNSGAGPGLTRADLSCSPGLSPGQGSQAASVAGPQALAQGLAGQLSGAGGSSALRRAGDGVGVKSGSAAPPGGIERIRSTSLSSQSGLTGASGQNTCVNSNSGGGSAGTGGSLKRSAQMAPGGTVGGVGVSGSGSAGSVGPGGGQLGGGANGGGLLGGPSGHKRSRVIHDLSFSDLPRHASYEDFDIFDKAENELSSDETIKDFYRIIHLYNENILRPVEMIHTLVSLFGQNSDVVNYMKRAVNYSTFIKDASSPSFGMSAMTNVAAGNTGRSSGSNTLGLGSNAGDRHTGSSDYRNEVDINSCLNFQRSYRQLPTAFKQPKCSGRDELCREVLNDKYISCASWLSEDTSVVASKKNMFEEYLYQVEDQRYELDMVIDLNYNVMQILHAHRREIENMSADNADRHTLDENLGCTSGILMRKALQRLYGEKTREIIAGLQRNPQLAIPLVLRRLQAKDEEWRTARCAFNDGWREAHERYYLKSLDYQGPAFKQNDFKVWRVKTLLSQIRTAHEEWKQRGSQRTQSQYVMTYPHDCPFNDAAALIIHHVKRQTTLSKEDKGRIKALVRRTFPLLFHHETTPLSDDEEDDMEVPATEEEDPSEEVGIKMETGDATAPAEVTAGPKAGEEDEKYTLLFGNNYWYVCLRLHHLLCERLVALRTKGREIAGEKADEKKNERADSTAEALRLRKPCLVPPEKYYEEGLEMVKSLLEGNLDNQTFEDQLRELFSIHAYIWFTMDKLMMTLTRQLQHIVTDERTLELTRQWRLQRSLNNRETGAGGRRATRVDRIEKEERYRRRAVRIINPDNEDSCYRIEIGWPTGEMRLDIIDPALPKLRVKPKGDREGRERGGPFQFSSLGELRAHDAEVDTWCKFLEASKRLGERVASSVLEDYMKKPRFCNRAFKCSNIRKNVCPEPAGPDEALPGGQSDVAEGEAEAMEVDSVDFEDEPEDEDEEEELAAKRRRRDDLREGEKDGEVSPGQRIREYGVRITAAMFKRKANSEQVLPHFELHYVHGNHSVPIYQLGGLVLECLWQRGAFCRARKAHERSLRPSSRRSQRFERVKAQWLNTADISGEAEEEFNNWFLGHDQPDLRRDICTECRESVDAFGHVRRTWVTVPSASQDSNHSSPAVASSGPENSVPGAPTGVTSGGSENGSGPMRLGGNSE